MIRYGVPACTLGSSSPMWILWVITGMSTRVAGIRIDGLRRVAEDADLHALAAAGRRGRVRSWWHLLQVAVLITSRVTVTAEPFGTKL